MGPWPFQNSDIEYLSQLLGSLDPVTGQWVSYQAQIRDRLDQFFIPANNRIPVMFRIDNADTFLQALSDWYAANPNAQIIKTEYLQDAAGTQIYLITYS